MQYLHQDPHLSIFFFFQKVCYFIFASSSLCSVCSMLFAGNTSKWPQHSYRLNLYVWSFLYPLTPLWWCSFLFSFPVFKWSQACLLSWFAFSVALILLFCFLQKCSVQRQCLFWNSIHTACDFSVILFLRPIFHLWFHCEHFIQLPWRYKSVIQTLLVFSNVIFILNVIITSLFFP